jgi:glycosyltransferase involved in cell wall biosynthesis
MCTYNGERFVAEQTLSIVEQLAAGDELIIADDGSTDDTVQTATDVASRGVASVRVLVNDEPRGVVPNFDNAIAHATGDLVVLADQDDVWRRDKVRVLRREFAARDDLVAVFSDAALLETVRSTDTTLWDANGVDWFARRRLRRGRAFEQLLRRNVVTGSTLAFRARVASLALPIPSVTMHDYWLALVAAGLGPIRAIDEPLIDYRVHVGQLVGPEPLTLRAQAERRRENPSTRAEELVMFTALRDRLAGFLDRHSESLLDAKIAFLGRRAALPPRLVLRLSRIAVDLVKLNYHRFGRGFRSAGRDAIFGH